MLGIVIFTLDSSTSWTIAPHVGVVSKPAHTNLAALKWLISTLKIEKVYIFPQTNLTEENEVKITNIPFFLFTFLCNFPRENNKKNQQQTEATQIVARVSKIETGKMIKVEEWKSSLDTYEKHEI